MNVEITGPKILWESSWSVPLLAVAWVMTAVVYRWGNLHGRVIVGEERDTSALRILSERENARPVRQDAGSRMA